MQALIVATKDFQDAYKQLNPRMQKIVDKNSLSFHALYVPRIAGPQIETGKDGKCLDLLHYYYEAASLSV